LLEPYIAEKATIAITKEDLNRLEKLIKESEYAIKNDIAFESGSIEIEFHRIIARASPGNPDFDVYSRFRRESSHRHKSDFENQAKSFQEKLLRAHKTYLLTPC